MKNLLYGFLVILMFFVVSCSTKPQGESRKSSQNCEVTLNEFPAFRGLKIGMPLELNPTSYDNQKYSVKYRSDSSVKNQNQEIENAQELGYIRREFHVSRIREQIKDTKIADSIDVKNLETIEVEIFDSKLIDFVLKYDKSMKSPSMIITTDKLAGFLNLPKDSFDIDSSSAYCFCKDFLVNIHDTVQIRVQISPKPEFFYDITNNLIERDKERTIKKQNTFSP